jgi:hypothetical protein
VIVSNTRDGLFDAAEELTRRAGRPESTLTTLRRRIAGFETQTELAASSDFRPASEVHTVLS